LIIPEIRLDVGKTTVLSHRTVWSSINKWRILRPFLFCLTKEEIELLKVGTQFLYANGNGLTAMIDEN